MTTMQKSKPKIPIEAENEIMEALSRNMRISTDQIVRILKKHKVCADSEKLQDSYRKRVGQRLMASIRDENGKRELFASGHGSDGSEYVIIEGCNDLKVLKDIRNRMQRSMTGLDVSANKLRKRIGFLERFKGRLPSQNKPKRRKT